MHYDLGCIGNNTGVMIWNKDMEKGDGIYEINLVRGADVM